MVLVCRMLSLWEDISLEWVVANCKNVFARKEIDKKQMNESADRNRNVKSMSNVMSMGVSVVDFTLRKEFLYEKCKTSRIKKEKKFFANYIYSF